MHNVEGREPKQKVKEVNRPTGKVNADINWKEAMQIYKPQKQIGVAVIDSGVAFDHPDLASNIWRNIGEILENGIDDDDNGYVDVRSKNSTGKYA